MTNTESVQLLKLLESFKESLRIRGALKLHQKICFDRMDDMIHDEIHRNYKGNIDSIQT